MMIGENRKALSFRVQLNGGKRTKFTYNSSDSVTKKIIQGSAEKKKAVHEKKIPPSIG